MNEGDSYILLYMLMAVALGSGTPNWTLSTSASGSYVVRIIALLLDPMLPLPQ